MKTVYLPHFTVGTDAYDVFQSILPMYGKTCALFYGEKAWAASKDRVLPALEKAGISIVAQGVYGKNATNENVDALCQTPHAKEADMWIGVGGGKCLDTVKRAADICHKPCFTCPSIASTCAAVTKISILYHPDGSFAEIVTLQEPPVHCFICTSTIAEAPVQYLWAGMGDTMAKHVESVFSARGDTLDYASRLGVKIGDLCFDGILEDGKQAYQDAQKHQTSTALENTILNILVSTGSVSVSVHPNYNSALAHALFYGLTVRPSIEKDHLHGEVVSYGTLVQLMMDDQTEDFQKAYAFNKALGLPTSLKDLDLDVESDLTDVLTTAENNSELKHVPYPVTKEKILAAMKKLEAYSEKENA